MSVTNDINAFSLITESLLKQNEKSIHIGGDCAYRGFSESLREQISEKFNISVSPEEDEDNLYNNYYLLNEIISAESPDLKCAIGFIISDSWYNLDIEDGDITTPSVLEAVQDSNPDWVITESSMSMLKSLQKIHDRKNVEEWENYFKLFTFTEDGTYINTDILT